MATLNQTNMLKAVEKAYMKTRYFHDGSDRLTFMVQAPITAGDGGKALITRYTYVGATAVIEGTTEYEGSWDADWDIEETDPE